MTPPPKRPKRDSPSEMLLREHAERLKQSRGPMPPEDRTLPPAAGTTLIKDPLWVRFKRWLLGSKP